MKSQPDSLTIEKEINKMYVSESLKHALRITPKLLCRKLSGRCFSQLRKHQYITLYSKVPANASGA